MENQILRVKNIQVSKLYGLYDHCINIDLDERIAIIHGPNGVGKTMLLKLVAALFSGRIIELARAKFSEFFVTLDDGSVLGIVREEQPDFLDDALDSESSLRKQQALFEPTLKPRSDRPAPRTIVKAVSIFNGAREETELGALPTKNSAAKIASFIDSETPWLYRTGPDQWIDREEKEYLTAYQVVEKYSDRLPARYQGKLFKEPAAFRNLRLRVKVHFIETQRLLKLSLQEPEWHRHSGDRAVVSMVKSDAVDLKEKISLTLANYGKNSQTLDQSFPWRLLHEANPRISRDFLKTKMENLEKKRGNLKKIGLIADDNSNQFDTNAIDSLDETRLDVLALYVSDTESKLSALDSLSQRVNLLIGIVNKKFRNKSISIDRQEGLKATSSTGLPLDLDDLSSGEQHELVLIYDLLFRVEADTLVLLDEPELSLHLTWQKQFLADLLSIVNATRFDAIVATHSPFIVGDRSDLMISLASGDSEE